MSGLKHGKKFIILLQENRMTEHRSPEAQAFIDANPDKFKIITPEETAKKMESTGERHLNWDFTQKDWNGKYSASGREDIGKYTTGENK